MQRSADPISGLGGFIDVSALDAGTHLKVEYHGKAVTAGDHLTASHTKGEPAVSIEVDKPDASASRFTVVMVDPDAPSPDNPIFAEFLHWIAVDVPANQALQKVKGGGGGGGEVVDYMGPAPPKGVHRYVFLAYRQPHGTEPFLDAHAQKQLQSRGRKKFSHAAFAQERGLGAPAAATYFCTAASDA
ncbi:phosphatidylethanolamine-binding protein [Tribonema minus]|uniref:Phosphatidylethanolamine-binding protein n=1 Tax=Tribonema minus TaxID=303371 RepID=A0A835YZ61_9STRA|nr:phosphatidylethanolamine-binding protein [Tribonema minus]